MNPLLQAAGVGFTIQGKELVRDVDLDLDAGGFVAVIGPNGSGKTTLLRMLAGVRQPTTGKVLMEGRPLGASGRVELAKRLSYVPQNTWTEFEITVLDAVALGRLPLLGPFRPMGRADFDAVHQAIEKVDLTEFTDRSLPTLSGGERQRVFVARALAQGSDILVLDEPTTSLDIGHQLELMDILAELHREGRTIIAAMHDLGLVWERFPRSVLLDRGRVVADGDTREVIAGGPGAAAFHVDLTEAGDGSLRIARS